jgi:hypothetical protein
MKKYKIIDNLQFNKTNMFSKEWIDYKKHLFVVVKKMKERQQSLSFEEVYIEAMEQAERIKKERLNNK